MDVKLLPIKESRTGKLQNRSAYVPEGVCFVALAGMTTSGKTYAFASLISQMFHPPVGGIWLVSKFPNQESLETLREWAEKNEYEWHDVGPELTEDVAKEVVANKLPKYLICDDWDARDKGTDLLISIFGKGRHAHVYPIVITQRFHTLPATLRANLNVVGLWASGMRSNSLLDLRALPTGLDNDQNRQVYEFVSRPENERSFIFVARGKPVRIFQIIKNSVKVFTVSQKSKKSEEKVSAD